MAASPDLFDAYFRQADTDRDGRISGQEAVSFFQGANLNREVLAKIWQYADQRQAGFLSRQEFYNALKLVTVAQTGRELTPAIVRGALQGPASSQIPAPQIPLTSGPMQPAQAAVAAAPAALLSQQFPNYPSVASQPGSYFPSGSQQGGLASQTRGLSVQPSGALTGNSTTWPSAAVSTSITNQNIQTKPPNGTSINFQGTKQNVVGGTVIQQANTNNLSNFVPISNLTVTKAPSSATKTPSSTSAESSLFGNDMFTATPINPPVQPQKHLSLPPSNATALGINLSGPPPQSKGGNIPNMIGPTDFALVPTFVPSVTSTNQNPSAMTVRSEPRVQGILATTTVDMTRTWPKMTDTVVRRYAKVFFEVDTDKDGKITGLQARDLFLSWKIPREVLKQIWDLSDQDHDSMLSLREFCVALHVMERYRDGLKLPSVLPSAHCFEDSGIQALRVAEAQVAQSQNSAGYGSSAWQHGPGPVRSSVQMAGLPPHPVTARSSLPPGVVKAPLSTMPASSEKGATAPSQLSQPKSRAPVLEMNLVNQLAADDQLKLQTKHQEAVDAEKKVVELEKDIMDAKEKMDFYRSKMQDIVLFKTRCDNRLNEITERAAADKREVETLAKKYDEKFKQAGESQSRLLADEAAFRDIQERRLELYNAIIRMQQGGDGNALVQSRADRLHNDLDELRKALNTKCKQMGLRIKPTSLVELPYGWQPGMQENTAAWDEDWDKFQDEGFAYVQDFMEEGSPGDDASKPRTIASWDEDGQVEDDTPSEGNHVSASHDTDSDNGVVINGDDDQHEVSPPSPEHPDSNVFSDKIATGIDLNHVEADSFTEDGGDWESAFTHKSEHADLQSAWGTNGFTNSTVPTQSVDSSSAFHFTDPFETPSTDHDNGSDIPVNHSSTFSYDFNDSFDIGNSKDTQDDLPSFNPIRMKETSSTFFDNSVPSTPLYSNTSSGGGFFDSSKDQFARFDSFKSTINDQSNSFSRFDSFSTDHDAGSAHDLRLFDESDSFSGNGPFRSTKTASSSTYTWNSFS